MTLLLKAGDAWSAWVLQASTGGHFTQRLTLLLNLGGGAAPAAVLVFGLVAIVLSLVQAVLMLFRQMALIVLAGVLPLAAAGSIAPMTRAWVRKVSVWMLALICYKPAAAAVYATAFTMIGSGGSPETALMGFVMLLLSVLTLPALMRFFTWTTGTIARSAGGGQLLGAATVGAIAIGAMRSSGGGSAQDQAAYLDSRLGPQPPGSSGGGPAGGPPSGGPPSGPGVDERRQLLRRRGGPIPALGRGTDSPAGRSRQLRAPRPVPCHREPLTRPPRARPDPPGQPAAAQPAPRPRHQPQGRSSRGCRGADRSGHGAARHRRHGRRRTSDDQ